MEEHISNLETELQATKEHLKKYTAPASNKVYYEKHKDVHKHSVIRCKTNECKLCCLDRDINASKNILGLLLNQYRGEERPVCFKPAKIGVIPCKSDKRPKACDSPLLTC